MSNLQNNTTGLQAILAAVNALPEAPEPLPDLIADEPETMGQRACLARAKQFCDITVTPVGALPVTGETTGTTTTVPPGTTITGLPYSSTRKTDLFVGFNVSLYSYMTAIHNPRSVLYQDASVGISANGVNAPLWYGINCSTYLTYAHGFPYHAATAALPDLEFLEEITDYTQMQLCDMPIASLSHGGKIGHAVLISGITRKADGSIDTVETMESTLPYVRRKTYTYDSFIYNFITAMGYKVYRNTRLYRASYAPSPFVKVESDEPEETIVYSALCPSIGDKRAISADDSITLNVLVDSGYESIRVFRDGELYGDYNVLDGHIISGDLTLSGMSSGQYTAVLRDSSGENIDNASCAWSVQNVSASRYGSRYYFTGDGVPERLVLKDSNGYTLASYEISAEDAERRYKDIAYAGDTPDTVCVAYKDDYGFVVARFAYSVQSQPEWDVDETGLPAGYQQVEYIETNGGQYIDTGILASDHSDGIAYTFRGNRTGVTSTSQTSYLWGANSDGSRSGNMAVVAAQSRYGVICGGSSGVLTYINWTAVGTDFELTLTATSLKTGSKKELPATLNGNAFTWSGAGTNTAMPAVNIYLFACNGVDTARGYLGKCYSFTMADASGNAIRNFVPCYRKSDSVVGLYDTVSGAFFTNAGTGSFTAGPEV